jgi:hypothetical protein
MQILVINDLLCVSWFSPHFDQKKKSNTFRSVAIFSPRAVFKHGPKGPGPRAANFQGWHIKNIEIEVWYAGKKKKAVHEREI